MVARGNSKFKAWSQEIRVLEKTVKTVCLCTMSITFLMVILAFPLVSNLLRGN